MFSYLFSQLSRSFGVFFRTIRSLIIRRFSSITTRVRQLTNVSRGATKAATASVQAAAAAMKKPTGQEDYIETSRLFISKAFLVKVVILLATLGLIGYFVVWPFVLSQFLTARFYMEDTRIPDWSGRVIVYADPDKTIPLYAGRLEQGALQGAGKEYDADGLLIYEGQFLNGVRSGEGKAYEAGVLCYEGQFADGLYEGRGKLYQDGTLTYEGNFQAGQASGTGTAYYKDGTTAYRGQFAEGLYEGTGTAYDAEGEILYEGSFSQGLYNGSGRLYLESKQWIDAEFQAGAPAGVVQWYKDGRLYYEGEWSDNTPQGYGTLYDKSGSTLYQGQFSRGTLDGSWLMGLSVEDLRAALGTQSATEVNENGGFLVTSPGLGLTALCSFQTEEADAAIHAIYLAAPSDGKNTGWVELLPGSDHAKLPEWPAGANQRRGSVNYTPVSGIKLAAGVYEALDVEMEDSQAICLYNENNDAVLMVWSKPGEGPAALDLTAMTDDSGAAQMEAFLASLDLGDGSAAQVLAENPYYGLKDPAEALAQCTDLQQAVDLIKAMLDYWEQAELQVALEENLARAQELLEDAKTQQATGSGSDETVAALEDQVEELNSQIASCQAQRSLAVLEGQAVGIENLADYAVSLVALYFDPSATTSEQFALAATAFAQVSGTDTNQAKLSAMSSVVNLTEDYGKVQTAVNRYESAKLAAETAASGYATGTTDKTSWYNALSAQADARSSLYSELAAFAREANVLNSLTGGWVTQNYSWYPDQLEPLFSAKSDAQIASDALKFPGIKLGWLTIVPNEKAENPYYGTQNPAEALAGCKSGDKASQVLDHMLSFWKEAEIQESLEDNMARARELLADAQAAGNQADVATLQNEIKGIQSRINDCLKQRAIDLALGLAAGVPDLSDYALDQVLIFFDPAAADSSALTKAAMDAAEAAGKDPAAAKLAVMNALAALTEDYNQVQAAQAKYQSAQATVQTVGEQYQAGAATKASWYNALSAQENARSALCSALAAFGQEANRLNVTTAGWLSQNYGWLSDALTPLLSSGS